MAKTTPEQGPTYMVQSVTLCLIYHADTFTHLARVLNHSACISEPDAFHAHLAEGLRAQFPDYPCAPLPSDGPSGQQLLYLLARCYASHAAYLRAPILSPSEAWCFVNVILNWLYTAALLLPLLRRRLSPRLQLAFIGANIINDLFTPTICWGLVPSLPPTFMRHYTPVLCEALGYTAFVGLPPRFVYFVCTIVTLSLGTTTALLIQHGLVEQVTYRLPSLWVRQIITLVAVVIFTALRGRIWRRFMTPGGMSREPSSSAVPWLLEEQEGAAMPSRSPPYTNQLMRRLRQDWYSWLSWSSFFRGAMVAVLTGLRGGNGGPDTSPQRGDSEEKARLDRGGVSGAVQDYAGVVRAGLSEQLFSEAAVVRQSAVAAANCVVDGIGREQVPFQQLQKQQWRHQPSTSSPVEEWFSLDERITAARPTRSDASGGGSGGNSLGEEVPRWGIVKPSSGGHIARSGHNCKRAQAAWQRDGYGDEDGDGSSGGGDGGWEGQLLDGSDCPRDRSLGNGGGQQHQRRQLPSALLQPALQLETQLPRSSRVTPPHCEVQAVATAAPAAGQQPVLPIRPQHTYQSTEQRHPSCSHQLWPVSHLLQLQVGSHQSGSARLSIAAAATTSAIDAIASTDASREDSAAPGGPAVAKRNAYNGEGSGWKVLNRVRPFRAVPADEGASPPSPSLSSANPNVSISSFDASSPPAAQSTASRSRPGNSSVHYSNLALSSGRPPAAKATPVTVGELRTMVAAARVAPYSPDTRVHLTRVHLRLPGMMAAELSSGWREEVLLRLNRTLPADYTVIGLAAFDSSSMQTADDAVGLSESYKAPGK